MAITNKKFQLRCRKKAHNEQKKKKTGRIIFIQAFQTRETIYGNTRS